MHGGKQEEREGDVCVCVRGCGGDGDVGGSSNECCIVGSYWPWQ